MHVFGYLRAWRRVRRIVSGRHVRVFVLPDGREQTIVRYTTPEAVEADYPREPSGEYRLALSAFPFPLPHGWSEVSEPREVVVSRVTIGVVREGFGPPLLLGSVSR